MCAMIGWAYVRNDRLDRLSKALLEINYKGFSDFLKFFVCLQGKKMQFDCNFFAFSNFNFVFFFISILSLAPFWYFFENKKTRNLFFVIWSGLHFYTLFFFHFIFIPTALMFCLKILFDTKQNFLKLSCSETETFRGFFLFFSLSVSIFFDHLILDWQNFYFCLLSCLFLRFLNDNFRFFSTSIPSIRLLGTLANVYLFLVFGFINHFLLFLFIFFLMIGYRIKFFFLMCEPDSTAY